jgi:hypothetical protein
MRAVQKASSSGSKHQKASQFGKRQFRQGVVQKASSSESEFFRKRAVQKASSSESEHQKASQFRK